MKNDPAIPLLGPYPKETKTLCQRDICTPMFTAALFTIAKTWKQTKCWSTDEWIKKSLYICIYVCVCVYMCVCVYIYVCIYIYQPLQKQKETPAICDNMDGPWG